MKSLTRFAAFACATLMLMTPHTVAVPLWDFTLEYVVDAETGQVTYSVLGAYTSFVDCQSGWVEGYSEVTSTADPRKVIRYSASYLLGRIQISDQESGTVTTRELSCASFSIRPIAPQPVNHDGWTHMTAKSPLGIDCNGSWVGSDALGPLTETISSPLPVRKDAIGVCLRARGAATATGAVPFTGQVYARIKDRDGFTVAEGFTCNMIGGVCWVSGYVYNRSWRDCDNWFNDPCLYQLYSSASGFVSTVDPVGNWGAYGMAVY